MVLHLVEKRLPEVPPPCSEAGLRVVPLEGAGDCQDGSVRCFSIRDEASGEGLAVLELRRGSDGRWKAAGLRGRANAEVTDLLVRLLASCVALRYDRAERQAVAGLTS